MISNKNVLKEFIKFGIVGVSNTFINLLLLYLLTSVVGIYYLISAIIAFVVANLNSFVLNKTWTFRENLKKNFFKKYVKFFVVSLNSLIIDLAALYLFTEVFHLYYMFSQAIAIALSFGLNFFFNKKFTFTNDLKRPEPKVQC